MSGKINVALMRRNAALLRQDQERQQVQASGGGSSGGMFDNAGPPHWDRNAWEAFHARYGNYPFGPQKDGGFIAPPNYVGCPDWAYEIINAGGRRPPIEYNPEMDNSLR